jgi:hypothetical protein
MTEQQLERRSFHRGDFSFKVKFRIMPPDEGRLKAMKGKGVLQGSEKILKINDALTDNNEKDAPLNAALIDFLIRMDEKLDQILTALADNNSQDRSFRECRGIDISATGMGIITVHPVKAGQIIEANITLSRLPLVSMDVACEVVQVTRIIENDQTMLHAGVRFLDLDAQDKEKIIKCVFQNERATIREKKRMEEDEATTAVDSSS